MVGVALPGSQTRLAHDDHAGRAAVDTQAAARTDVLIDHEHDPLRQVSTGLFGIARQSHRAGRQQVHTRSVGSASTA
jgi:hypothetical protein